MTDPRGWRPIASAPKDGTDFIAAIKVRYRRGGAFTWRLDILAMDPETGDIEDDRYSGWRFEDYTHWMPLPDPPETDDGE